MGEAGGHPRLPRVRLRRRHLPLCRRRHAAPRARARSAAAPEPRGGRVSLGAAWPLLKTADAPREAAARTALRAVRRLLEDEADRSIELIIFRDAPAGGLRHQGLREPDAALLPALACRRARPPKSTTSRTPHAHTPLM